MKKILSNTLFPFPYEEIKLGFGGSRYPTFSKDKTYTKLSDAEHYIRQTYESTKLEPYGKLVIEIKMQDDDEITLEMIHMIYNKLKDSDLMKNGVIQSLANQWLLTRIQRSIRFNNHLVPLSIIKWIIANTDNIEETEVKESRIEEFYSDENFDIPENERFQEITYEKIVFTDGTTYRIGDEVTFKGLYSGGKHHPNQTATGKLTMIDPSYDVISIDPNYLLLHRRFSIYQIIND